jgi:threonine dehydratase
VKNPERGARNALMLLSPEQQKRGVIAASAGNHALGVAYHAQLLRIPATVVMPRFAPLTKVVNCRRLGANVLLEGANIAEEGASIIDITHDRAFADDDITTVAVHCVVETRDAKHIKALKSRLDKEGFRVV